MPHHSGTLLQPGDLDTDSEDDRTTEQLIQEAALRQEQQAADLAGATGAPAASQAAQRPATRPQLSRRQSIVEQVFGIITRSSQQHQEQTPAGAFPGTPERFTGRTVERETPPPPPTTPPPQNTMSAQGDVGPSSRPKMKLPQPAKFIGEGDDLKSDKVKRWFWEIKKYLSKHDVNDDTEDVVDYYGALQRNEHTTSTLPYWMNTMKNRPPLNNSRPDSSSFSKPPPIPTTSSRNGRRYNRLLEEIQHVYQR